MLHTLENPAPQSNLNSRQSLTAMQLEMSVKEFTLMLKVQLNTSGLPEPPQSRNTLTISSSNLLTHQADVLLRPSQSQDPSHTMTTPPTIATCITHSKTLTPSPTNQSTTASSQLTSQKKPATSIE